MKLLCRSERQDVPEPAPLITNARAIVETYICSKGPWGTGKTKFDVLVAMLVISAGKKAKVLSPTNKAAQSFIRNLNAEIAHLEDAEIVITDKHIVRFHSPTTECAVVHKDRQRNMTHDIENAR